jgi:hypothetical protein
LKERNMVEQRDGKIEVPGVKAEVAMVLKKPVE